MFSKQKKNLYVPYVEKQSFDDRLQETKRIIEKYPDRIPCIVEKSVGSPDHLKSLEKIKYLVPNSLTFGQFMLIIRKRLRVKSEYALYFFINKKIMANVSQTMGELYDDHKSPCGFLYFEYATENAFGKS